MKRKIVSFNQFFINEEEGATGSPTASSSSSSSSTELKGPETEKEAKSRIALGIVKSIFGDFPGLTGGVDTLIDQTKEVKESLPYKGCGASSTYPLEKTPMSVLTIKILLDYLQNEKKAGDYTRVINELKEKRAVIIGIRNYIDVKKETANQDRFCDALYFVPGNAKDGTESSGATGATGATAGNTPKKDDKKKNESLESLVEEQINYIEAVAESGLWTFEDFNKMSNARLSLIECRDRFIDGEITEQEFLKIYEGILDVIAAPFKWAGQKLGLIGDDKPKAPKYNIDAEDEPTKKKDTKSLTPAAPAAPTPPASLGDLITPYQITTVASLSYYGKKPMNPKGVGIKLPGDTLYLLQESTLGSGTKYKMMVEGEQIKVGRYPIGVTKYETYKPGSVYTENCGMQIHRSSTKGVGVCIGPWSAGCQVFSDNDEWKEFISKSEKESMNGGKFLYALIQLDDIPKEVLASAMIGLPYSATTPTAQTSGATGATGASKGGGLKNFGKITEG